MAYSDFPMPPQYPDFPSHKQISDYFDAYVDHFGFRSTITFNTRVLKADRNDQGQWTIALSDGSVRRFDALAVANGHHWDPRWPDPAYPGPFAGREMHSHDYRDERGFEGKRVVVVGMGNSAMDIADEVSRVAERTFLSARRGAYVIPKYALGRPVDSMPLSPRLPWRVRQRILELVYKLSVGSVEAYGLPKPDHRIGEAHPTISSTILSRIAHGEVVVKPNLVEKLGDRVRFSDGSIEAIDVIVYCTGYKVTFEFFDADFVAAPNNDLPLFRRVFLPRFDNLFFIGLLQPLGAIMPLAEAQSEWVADDLLGQYALPPKGEMLADMNRERTAMFRRYVASPRHTMQVDFDDYLHELAQERRKGGRRARHQGFRRPLGASPMGVTAEAQTQGPSIRPRDPAGITSR
jgi:cation diffusion facilitator CzcD-associated flavoprotein CzcO